MINSAYGVISRQASSACDRALPSEIILHISIAGQMVRFDRVCSVGRNGDICIYTRIPWVSRRHFEVMADKSATIWIRDIDSKAGTFVNGVRIGSAWFKIHPADQVTIGGILPVHLHRTSADKLLKAERLAG